MANLYSKSNNASATLPGNSATGKLRILIIASGELKSVVVSSGG